MRKDFGVGVILLNRFMRIKNFIYFFFVLFLSCNEKETTFSRIEINKFSTKSVKSFVIDDSGFVFEINGASDKISYFKRELKSSDLDKVYNCIMNFDSLKINKNAMSSHQEFYFIRVFKNDKPIFTFQESYNYTPSLNKNDSVYKNLIEVIEKTAKDSVLTNFSKYQNISKVIDNEVKATQ